MRYVNVVLLQWFRVVAVPGSIQTLLFPFFCLKLEFIITITAKTAQSYPRAVLMQRLSTRSAKRQKVIHARSTLIEVYLTTLCLLIKLLRLKFLTQYILLTYFSKLLRLTFLMHYTLITYFSKPVEANIFNTLHSAD